MDESAAGISTVADLGSGVEHLFDSRRSAGFRMAPGNTEQTRNAQSVQAALKKFTDSHNCSSAIHNAIFTPKS
jgi:hypothetical protein